jgi:hypothetical protein
VRAPNESGRSTIPGIDPNERARGGRNLGPIRRKTPYPAYNLPAKRKVNDEITSIICGERAKNNFLIVRGHTVVAQDMKATYSEIPVLSTDVLYVDGEFDTAKFAALVTDHLSNEDTLIRAKTKEIRENLRANDSAMRVFNKWNPSFQQFREVTLPKTFGSPFTESDIQTLFSAAFDSVEAILTDAVGPPNNARIISLSGRKTTTIDADPWPNCARKNASTPTKQRR